MDENKNLTELESNLFEGLYALDTERRITKWNKAAEQITGYTAKEAIGSKCSDNMLIHVDSDGCELCKESCPASECMEKDQLQDVQVFLHHKMGHRVPVRVRVFPVKDKDQEITGAIELFAAGDSPDFLSSRIKSLEELVLTDPLTKLPNRKYVEEGIRANIALYERLSIPFSVIFIDIDNLKAINDKYGHIAGDKLIKAVAQTISKCARPSDIIGRWGGDEFLGYLPGSNLKSAINLAQRLLKLIASTSIAISEDILIHPTASIGVSEIMDDDKLPSIMNRADKLMYKAKTMGGNLVCSS